MRFPEPFIMEIYNCVQIFEQTYNLPTPITRVQSKV